MAGRPASPTWDDEAMKPARNDRAPPSRWPRFAPAALSISMPRGGASPTRHQHPQVQKARSLRVCQKVRLVDVAYPELVGDHRRGRRRTRLANGRVQKEVEATKMTTLLLSRWRLTCASAQQLCRCTVIVINARPCEAPTARRRFVASAKICRVSGFECG